MPSLNSVVATLIGPGNAAGLFPFIAPSPEGVSSTLIGPGNAAGLFPLISPAATPSPSPEAPGGLPQAAGRHIPPAAPAVEIARVSGMPVLTAQVIGLIALALAVLLTITRVFRHGRRT